MKSRILDKRWLIVSLLLIGSTIGSWFWVGFHPRVWIDDARLDHLAPSEQRNQLETWLNERQKRPILVRSGKGLCELGFALGELRLDLGETTNRIEAARRQRHLGDVRVTPAIHVDAKAARSVLERCEATTLPERPVVGSVTFVDGSVRLLPSRAGERLSLEGVERLLAEAMLRRPEPLAWPRDVVPAFPPLSLLERVRDEFERLTRRRIRLRSPLVGASLRLGRDELGRMLATQQGPDQQLSLGVMPEVLREVLGERAMVLERPVMDATFRENERGQLEAVAEREGIRIDWEKLAVELFRALLAESGELQVPTVPESEPRRRLADLEGLSMTDRLSTFSTRYQSGKPRVKNIQRIAALTDGVIVLPEQTFSLNQHVGMRTIQRGFVMAPGIEDGDMRDSVGGGVSQFATTLYNAVLRAGFEIEESQAHSYWFDRYPMGHEATLSFPKPDLAWKNDSTTPVLITARTTDRSVTVTLWGSSDGRRVSYGIGPRTDIVPPPVEVLPNPELEADERRTKNGGRIGWSVMVWREVLMGDGRKRRDEKRVVYRPEVRRVEVHPCHIPRGEPGFTGEECPQPIEESATTEGETAPAAPPDDASPR